jgi:hypothetical protein
MATMTKQQAADLENKIKTIMILNSPEALKAAAALKEEKEQIKASINNIAERVYTREPAAEKQHTRKFSR